MTVPADTNLREALEPCPFCGPGQSMVDPWFDDVSKRWAIGCGRCGASSGRSVHAEGSKEAAIKSWNTRGLASEPVAGTVRDGKCTFPDCRCITAPPCPHYAHQPLSAPPAPAGREEMARIVLQARGYDLAVEQKWAAKGHAASINMVCDAFIVADAILALGATVTPQGDRTTASAPEPISDSELAGWARNWHWNDCAEDKPVDLSIYSRDMRLLKAFIARATPPAPGAADRAAVIEEIAADFENSVHHVWDSGEVADRIRALAPKGAA